MLEQSHAVGIESQRGPRIVAWTLVSMLAVVAGCSPSDRRPHTDAGMSTDGGGIDSAVDAATDTDASIDSGPVTGDLCPTGPCNLITSTGCSSGACRYLSPDGTSPPVAMCEGSGTRTVGQGCITYDDCAPGLLCSPLTSACVEYCCGGSSASCSAGTFCLDLWDGAGFCELDRDCDLFTSADCSAGESCTLADDLGSTICLERTAENGEGDACTGIGCAAGLVCARADGATANTCLRFCHTGNQAECNAGQRCIDNHYPRSPEAGTCERVDDACSGSPNTGACTNTADCAVYEADELAAVSAAIACASEVDRAACIATRTGLSSPCATCFASVTTTDRATFLSCAGF